jgi:hypothetical protein
MDDGRGIPFYGRHLGIDWIFFFDGIQPPGALTTGGDAPAPILTVGPDVCAGLSSLMATMPTTAAAAAATATTAIVPAERPPAVPAAAPPTPAPTPTSVLVC